MSHTISSSERAQLAEIAAALLHVPAGLAALVSVGHLCAAGQNYLPEIVTHWRGWTMLMGLWAEYVPTTHLALAFEYLCEALIFYRISDILNGCLRGEIFTRQNVRSLHLIGVAGLAGICIPLCSGIVDGWNSVPAGSSSPEKPLNLVTDVDGLPSLGLIALPFVMAWIFQKGLDLRKELDEVI